MREISSEEVGKLYGCLEELALHHNRVSVYFEGHYPFTPIDQTIDRFKRELESGKSFISVIENDQKIIGFCKINADDDKGVLEYLVVLEEERGHGYGGELMNWAIEKFQKLEVSDIDVKVVFGNNAMDLYKKYGFKEKSVVLGLCKESIKKGE